MGAQAGLSTHGRHADGNPAGAATTLNPNSAEFSTTSAPSAGSAATLNAMSVDVEDYFQVSAFSHLVDRDDWDGIASRVEANVDRILGLFSDHGVHATFFTLSWVAERNPALVRRIVDSGHELASHGVEHVQVFKQTPETFRTDVRMAKRCLEDIGGTRVRGYRAASFSIDRRTPWAYKILAEEGHLYSSSIYPIKHDHYGMPDAPRFAHRPSDDSALIELPLTTTRRFGRNLPSAGGGYFRLLPYDLSRRNMRRVNRLDRQPCIFYFHPWEIDPGQPRFPDTPLKTRVRHYINLKRMEHRLHKLLSDFRWDRIDRVFGLTEDR